MRIRPPYLTIIVFAFLWIVTLISFKSCSITDIPTSTLVYSSDTTLIGGRIATDGQWRIKSNTPLPHRMSQCLIEAEDHRFYRHIGVDPIAIARAIRHNTSNLSSSRREGGSTITMQLMRLLRGNQKRNIGNKIIESIWALHYEIYHTKESIIQRYAALAPMGGNVVGVEAAAWRYWGRSVAHLSWAECATLAVLPNSPSLIHPGRNRELLVNRRNNLLLRLCSQGIIDRETYELSILEELPERPLPMPSYAPHLTDKMASRHRGDNIITDIDADLQVRVANIARRHTRINASKNYVNDAAILVIDVNTGKTLAYVVEGTSNDMICAHRSTGSILKPFLYAAMMDDGRITPEALVADVPLNLGGFSPKNFSKKYSGAVTARSVIEKSLNVPMVRMVLQYDISRFLLMLKRLGLTTMTRSADDYGASIILGGAEGRLDEICQAYRRCAKQLNEYGSNESPKDKILSDGSLWYMFDAMSGLNRPEEEEEWRYFDSMHRVAWKTGTSFGNRDAWAIGVTPDYVVGVWVGNASGEGRAGMTGVAYAAPIMFDVVASIRANRRWWDMPLDDMEYIPVCHDSGWPASDICPSADTLLVPRNCIETQICHYHRLVHLSEDGIYRVNNECYPVSKMQHRAMFILPPAQEYYYKMMHAEYEPLPPMMEGCGSSTGSVDIIFPENNTSVVPVHDMSTEDGRYSPVVAQVAANSQEIYWHIDDNYLGLTTSDIGHTMPLFLPAGKHRLTVVTPEGSSASVQFEVIKKE